LSVSKNSRSRFLRFVFFGAFCGYKVHATAKVSGGTNRNLPAGNTLVPLLALYTDHESHNAQRQRQTDGQTDDMTMPITDHTVYYSSTIGYKPNTDLMALLQTIILVAIEKAAMCVFNA